MKAKAARWLGGMLCALLVAACSAKELCSDEAKAGVVFPCTDASADAAHEASVDAGMPDGETDSGPMVL